MEYGCGQCMPCRINRRRLWTGRLLLEARQHASSSFVTLTYDEEEVPDDGSLRPEDTQRFLKRLRKLVPVQLRYFLVGEYGDVTWRPHYHAALFGLPSQLLYLDSNGAVRCDAIGKAWPFGFYQVGEINAQSAAYLAGYTVKKLTREKDNEERLKGRRPEFARMSLRPGIGAGATKAIGEYLSTRVGSRAVAAAGDIPGAVRYAGRMYPLGRYLKGRVRESVGMEKKAPEAVVAAVAEELAAVAVDPAASAARAQKRVQGGRIASARVRLSNLRKGV